MAWPPTIPPADRTNDTLSVNNHPSDHNGISGALAEIVAQVNTKMSVNGGTASPIVLGPVGQQVTISSGNITAPGGITAGGGTHLFEDGSAIFPQGMTGEDLRLTATGDVSLSSTAHAFQIGPSNGFNLAVDNNEIQARNNGAASNLTLNQGGGNVIVGSGEMQADVVRTDLILSSGSKVTVMDSLDVTGLLNPLLGIDCNQAISGQTLISNTTVLAAGLIASGPGGAGATNYGIQMRPNGWIQSVTSDDSRSSIRLWRAGAAADTGNGFIAFFRSVPWGTDTQCGSIKVASSNSVVYDTTSDARLKTPTGDAADSLDVVSQLGAKVYKGRWTAEGDQGQEWVFVNAQDVEPLAPYAASGDPEGDPEAAPMAVDYNALVPLLLAAVSQLAEKVAALESA